MPRHRRRSRSHSPGASRGNRHRGRSRHGQAAWISGFSGFDFDSFFSFRPSHCRRRGGCRELRYTLDEDNRPVPLPGDGHDSRAPDPDPVKTLQINQLDLKVQANGTAHRTSNYDISSLEKSRPKLVVRRGQPFNMDVHLNRPYNQATDDLRLVFLAGDKPVLSKGTKVEILLSAQDKNKEWGAKILESDGATLCVTVFTPPTAYVGKWTLNVDTVEKDSTSRRVYTYVHNDPVYIIFNPWCKDDGVYMDKDEELKEYVLNETGRIYSGSSKSVTSKPWNFGQFEGHVLDVALDLLSAGDLKWTVRGNPVAVVRKMTAMVNSSDDNGVLTGNWSGDYKGGRSPLSWTGSAAILERYWKDKRPVRYGQCWVFSGVTTTLMRTLGIPARSVTNFQSAHDTDGSITIDYHFNEEGEPDEEEDEDSIWNFHVWNEVWMARPDLPQGYGGWQVVDSTPQEASDGIYVCGPAPVQAIRQGEVNLPYDAPFVFAEVNADCMYWMMDKQLGEYQPVHLDKKKVGKYISTKACNSDDRNDLTGHYKPAEGSAEERASVLRANLVGSTREDIYGQVQEDVGFDVEQNSQNTWVGEEFVVALRMKNSSQQVRTLSGRAVVKSMFYTGVTSDRIKSQPLSHSPVVVQPGHAHVHELCVRADEYLPLLKDGCMLDVTFLVQVQETGQVFTFKEDFRLRKPHLTIKAPGEVVAGKEFVVHLSFLNPLDTTLTGCVVEVDGLARDISFPQGNVAAKGTFSAKIPVTASKKGHKELIVVFSSRQLEDINGAHKIFISQLNNHN